MTVAWQVLAMAKGRVWTGRQALERGLIDYLGGMDTAVDISRQAGGDVERVGPEFLSSRIQTLAR